MAGRKSKADKWLTEEGLKQIAEWAGMGLVDTQIAHNMGININTLNSWKRKYPKIYKTLQDAKEVVDLEVENALLKKALGFEYVEIVERDSDGDGSSYKEIRHKYQPPDTTAAIFWLKNRQRKRWTNNPNELEIKRAEVQIKKMLAEDKDW